MERLVPKCVPITERSSALTQDIDKANAREVISLLQKCDAQIFSGWEDNEGIFSKRITTNLECVARKAAECVTPCADRANVILSGCGTSGRIAFLISRGFNELARRQNLRACYRYICAGSDHALTRSVEPCEDDWNAGKEALVKEADGSKKVLFIGITCGLSLWEARWSIACSTRIGLRLTCLDLILPIRHEIRPSKEQRKCYWILLEKWKVKQI